MAKQPRFVGVNPDPSDPVLRGYREGVQKRAEAMRKERPGVGNLAQASALYKPGQDGPMTIRQVVDSQKRMEQPERTLSNETVEVMKAVAAYSTQAKTAQERSPMEQPQQPQAQLQQDVQDRNKRSVLEEVERLDDFDLERLMRSVQQDVINNEKERKAVRERCKEVDIADGIAKGVFQQEVDITPGKLVVVYRTLSTMEHQEIRTWIFNNAQKDLTGKIDKLAAEIYGLATVVASVVRINKTTYPEHLSGEAYAKTFNAEVFEKKYNMFLAMPTPLVHAIGTHGNWFDLRMREMFTTEALKNG